MVGKSPVVWLRIDPCCLGCLHHLYLRLNLCFSCVGAFDGRSKLAVFAKDAVTFFTCTISDGKSAIRLPICDEFRGTWQVLAPSRAAAPA
eukprot:2667255-Rhodomonas_salina.1